MKAILLTTLAIVAAIFTSCSHTDSDYETEQAELEAEEAELRREYAELKEKYLREKAEFQKEQKALHKSVRKGHNTNSVRRDTIMRQLTDPEMSELTDKIKSAGLWPTSK